MNIEVKREQLRSLVKSIGFNCVKNESDKNYYTYKDYDIDLYEDFYDFYDGTKWIWDLEYDDLEKFEECFKKELRSIKLKQLLNN